MSVELHIKTSNVLVKDGVTWKPVECTITTTGQLLKKIVHCELEFGARIISYDREARTMTLRTRVMGNVDTMAIKDESLSKEPFDRFMDMIDIYISQHPGMELTDEAFKTREVAEESIRHWLATSGSNPVRAMKTVLLNAGIKLERDKDVLPSFEFFLEGMSPEEIMALAQ